MNDYDLLYLIYQHDDEALEILLKKHEKNIYFAVKNAISLAHYQFSFSDEFKEFIHIANMEVQEAIFRYKDDGKCSFQSYALTCISLRLKKEIRQRRSNTNNLMTYAVRLDECVKEGEGMYFIDMIENTHREFEGNKILDPLNKKELLEYLKTKLKPYEYQIADMTMRGYSQSEISIKLNMTPKRVNYVCKKMRKLLSNQIQMKTFESRID